MSWTGGTGEKNASVICSVLWGLIFDKNGNNWCFSSTGTTMLPKEERLFEPRECPTERDRGAIKVSLILSRNKGPSREETELKSMKNNQMTHPSK